MPCHARGQRFQDARGPPPRADACEGAGAQLKLQQAASATKPAVLTPSRSLTNGDAHGRYSRGQAA